MKMLDLLTSLIKQNTTELLTDFQAMKLQNIVNSRENFNKGLAHIDQTTILKMKCNKNVIF